MEVKAAPTRRVKPAEPTSPGRRTTPQYKVVNKE